VKQAKTFEKSEPVKEWKNDTVPNKVTCQKTVRENGKQ